MNGVGNGVVGRKKFILLIFIYHRMYSVITICFYLRVSLELCKKLIAHQYDIFDL
jgi:hypothetical protein